MPIINRNVPPNASIIGPASMRYAAYTAGWLTANATTSVKCRPVVSTTMRIGSANRTTNTATRMPAVMNICCQNADMCFNNFALTTALSKLNVTSNTVNTITLTSATRAADVPCHQAVTPPTAAQMSKVDRAATR